MARDIIPEKTRHFRRLRIWAISPMIVITIVIVVTIKATSLNGLPDIGDPFDIEAFARPIPDATNAFVVYRQAFDKLGKEPDTGGVWTADWTSASPEQRRWLEKNREALDLWREGSTRPDASYISPRTLKVTTLLPVIQGMRSFARLAILEATRLQAEGDLPGALDWYLAVIRSSRHCGRRGGAIERLVGIAIGSMATGRLSTWAKEPKLDAATLRKALDALVEADAMTPPASDAFKCEYILFLNTIADPELEDPARLSSLTGGRSPWGWSSSGPGRALFRAERSVKREPERSRRVYRLVIANWLAYCDRPRSERPPFAVLAPPPPSQTPATPPGFALYVPEATAPDSVRALPPDELARWFDSTISARIMSCNYLSIDNAFRRDRTAFAHLLITLASELYRKENGADPAKADNLVGRYLRAIPEGYVPVEATAEGKPPVR